MFKIDSPMLKLWSIPFFSLVFCPFWTFVDSRLQSLDATQDARRSYAYAEYRSAELQVSGGTAEQCLIKNIAS